MVGMMTDNVFEPNQIFQQNDSKNIVIIDKEDVNVKIDGDDQFGFEQEVKYSMVSKLPQSS